MTLNWHNTALVQSLLANETDLAGMTVLSEDIKFTLNEYTSAQTLTADNYLVLVNASSGKITITLPPAVNHKNRIYTIKKIDSSSSAVIIDANSTEKIDGETTVKLGLQFDYVTIVSDAAKWHIIGGGNVKLEDLLNSLLTELKDQKEKLRLELVQIRLHQEKMSRLKITKVDVREAILEEENID